MPEPAIEAAQVTFAYPPLAPELPAATLFETLTCRLDAGESLTVLGASDSGKSALCYLLAGLAPRYTGGELQGRLRVLGHDVAASLPPAGAVGLLFQDAATQLFNSTVENEVAWGLESLAVPAPEIGPRVMQALQRFGMLEQRDRPPWALSGGQQKRLALAALWALRPRLLLLDEPLSGLDPAGRAEVLKSLELLRRGGATLLFTTPYLHDVSPAAGVTLLENGRLSTPVSSAELRAQEERLIAAGLRCPARYWDELTRSRATIGPEPAIEVRRLRFRYPSGLPVLHDLDLTIPQGQFVALVGANGAGKTTLVRHFNGLLRPTSGSLRVLGQESDSLSVGQLARQVGFLFQRPEQQIFGTTVLEEVTYGPRQLQLPDAEARVARALARFGLESSACRPPAILGYGTQRAVTLAALSALETPVLVLDEPTVGLDGRGWAQLLTWLAERRAAGVTLIIVTHEMSLAACADRVVVMEGGRVVADGPPETVLPPGQGPEDAG